MTPLRVLAPALLLLLLPAAPAAPLPAPDALDGARALLMLGESPLADECSTFAAGAFDAWAAWGKDGEWTRVRHNGEEASAEMLERAVLDARGEAWSDAFVVARQCEGEGGFCACASTSLWTGTSVWCLACCPAGATPFCFCDSLYVYAACSCGAEGSA